METVTLERVLDCPDLPSLPKVAIDLVELTRDPDADVAEVAKLVQFDQALTARVLRTVNSSYYGLAHPCTSLRRVMAYLGIKAVRSIVLGFSLVDVTRRGGKGLDLVDYWRRCVYSAATARRIAARTTQCDPEEAFIAALMQDVGMLTMHTAVTQAYDDIVGSTGGDHRRLPQFETRRFGFTHADAGAGLGARWRLPAQIVEPIRLHHHGDVGRTAGSGEDDTAGIVRAVSMSYRLATAIASDGGASELRIAYAMGDRYFGLTIDEVRGLVTEAAEDARALSGLLEVKIGDQVDLDRVLAEAQEVVKQHRSPVSNDDTANDAEPLAREALTADAMQADLGRRLAAAALADEDLGLVLIMPDDGAALEGCPAPVSDAVMSEIRRRISRFGGSDIAVHRTSVHTLAVILPRANREHATRMAEGVRARVALAPFTVPAHGDHPIQRIRFTVSGGIAAFDRATRRVFGRPEVLTAAAERALASAREHGNTVEAFRPGARAA